MTTQVSSGNLPIPNDTGANVLADINENLNALQSNNAGDNEPPVAKKHQWYVDTSGSTDVLKIKGNADNAAFITLGNIETNLGMMPKTGGNFTGSITTVAGTNTSPAIKLDSTNTGLYLPSANTIGLTCNGDLTSTVHGNGLTIASNKRLFLNNGNESASIGLKCQSSLNESWTLELPNDNGDAGEVLSTDGNGVTSWVSIQGVPTGTIMPYAGSETNIPSGYLECDGSQKSSTTYSALATVCSDTYNNGQTPSSGNFFLPDLRGEFIRGWDHGRGTDASRTRGTPQASKNKQHTHSSSNSVTVTGGDHSHQIRQVRRVGMGESSAQELVEGNSSAQRINLDHGQEYHIGYHKTDNYIALANTPVKSSGTLTSTGSATITINNDPFTVSGIDESRPRNISLIYIIKT